MQCLADGLVNGTGAGQGTGVLTGITWAENDNAVEYEDALGYNDITLTIGTLKRGYANGAVFAMNNGTLYTQVSKAREWLRIDGTDNDEIIQGLIDAVPGYIEITTGMTPEAQDVEPLAETAAKFILLLWYNAEQSEAERLQRCIDNLLKALAPKAKISSYLEGAKPT